jgi:hypothetical protein
MIAAEEERGAVITSPRDGGGAIQKKKPRQIVDPHTWTSKRKHKREVRLRE